MYLQHKSEKTGITGIYLCLTPNGDLSTPGGNVDKQDWETHMGKKPGQAAWAALSRGFREETGYLMPGPDKKRAFLRTSGGHVTLIVYGVTYAHLETNPTKLGYYARSPKHGMLPETVGTAIVIVSGTFGPLPSLGLNKTRRPGRPA